MRLAANDRHHQGQAQYTGANEGLGRAANADPDRQWILQRPGEDALPGERRAMPAFPSNVCVFPDLEQKVEFLGEKRVVVGQIEAEKRIRLGERATPGHDFRAAVRQQVKRGKLLENPHRVRGAEHGHRAGKPNMPGAGRRRGEQDRGRGIDIFLPMVLTDAENLDPDLVGQLDLFKQIAQPLDRTEHFPGHRIRSRGDKTIDADLHGILCALPSAHPRPCRRAERPGKRYRCGFSLISDLRLYRTKPSRQHSRGS